MIRRAVVVLAMFAIAGPGAGCALGSKAPIVEIHYFTPEAVDVPSPPPAAPLDPSAPPVRLGRVTSSASLRHRIVWRESAHELGSYDHQRWTDNPEVFLQRAVARALFAAGGARQVLAGGAPILDLDLVAFEEVRRGGSRSGRVRMLYVLRDDDAVLARGVLTAEEPAPAPGTMREIAGAVGVALDRVAAELAAALADPLRSAAAQPTPPRPVP